MSRRLRLLLFLLACGCLLPASVRLAKHMPTFGAHPMPYGEAINAVAPGERHVTNMVSAVNFDYRGFDTLGEEFMLLCAVTGVAVLLRGQWGEQIGAEPGVLPGRPIRERGALTVLIARVFSPGLVLFGVYVALHATTTPGGGFQGGVLIAAGLLLVFLGEGYAGWRRMVSSHAMDAVEGVGAALYAACGFAAMATGAAFLTNFLPLGKLGDLFSGGLMLVENAGVALAVAGGFTVLFGEFLEETRREKPDDGP